MNAILRRCVEVGATVAREGGEFGVLGRAVAVGGQRLTLQGLGGVYEDIFLPLHGAHQAQNAAVALAAVEAFLGAGADRQLDIAAVQDGFAASRPRPAGAGPHLADDPARRRAQPARHGGHGRRAAGGVRVQQAGRRARRAGRQGRGGMLELLEPMLDEVVVTRNSSPRAMPTEELAELAVEVFGAERVGRPRRCRRDRGGGGDGRGGRPGRAERGRGAGHRVRGDGRRRAQAAEAMTSPERDPHTAGDPTGAPVGEEPTAGSRALRVAQPGAGGTRSGRRHAQPGGAGAAAGDPADPGGRR